MLEQIKYIVKSKLGDIFIDNEKFEKVEKLRYFYAFDTLKGYQEHIEKGYDPIILKKNNNKWLEISLEELKKEVKPKKMRAIGIDSYRFFKGRKKI